MITHTMFLVSLTISFITQTANWLPVQTLHGLQVMYNALVYCTVRMWCIVNILNKTSQFSFRALCTLMYIYLVLHIYFLISFLFYLINPDRILQIKTVDVVYCKCFVIMILGYIVHTTRTYPSFCCIEQLGLSPHGKHSGHM